MTGEDAPARPRRGVEVLEGLARRVAAAEGPDRELDAAIADALWFRKPSAPGALDHALAEDALLPFSTRRGSAPQVPHLTASIDALAALAERRGMRWGKEIDGRAVAHHPAAGSHEAAPGATGPLTLCEAILRCETARLLGGRSP